MSAVHHPSHYHGGSGVEAISIITEWGLGFCGGNALKYISRHHHKGKPGEDLDKAIWYLLRGAATAEPILKQQASGAEDIFGAATALAETWGLPDCLIRVLALIQHAYFKKAAAVIRALQQEGKLPTSGAWDLPAEEPPA